MSKASNKRRHADKMKQRRAEKAAKRSAYAALAGTSKKNKRRNVKKSSVAGVYKHAHIMSDCGNVGCERCYPRIIVYNQLKLV